MGLWFYLFFLFYLFFFTFFFNLFSLFYLLKKKLFFLNKRYQFVCLRLSLDSFEEVLKAHRQPGKGQGKCYLLVCFLLCLDSLEEVLKAHRQPGKGQGKGRCPVCVRRWAFRRQGAENTWEHYCISYIHKLNSHIQLLFAANRG